MRKGAVILFKDGYCYQSYGWDVQRPLGKIQNILDHLEEYHVDEISIIRPVKGMDSDESFYSDILELSKIKSSTPLSFGGGLYNKERIDRVRSLSFERLIFSSSLLSNSNIISHTRNLTGKQAIVGSIPLKYVNSSLMVYNSILNKFVSIESINLKNISMCDELIVTDCSSEGASNSFNMNMLDHELFNSKKIIVSGGVNLNKKLSKEKKIVSILIENKVLHTEYSLKR
jgi:phosphoribosylformimino-5-aminoimidazole carboxamide ribonucleotide (ProFAR) isomerase